MLRSLTVFLVCIVSLPLFATHNIAGEITYKRISDTSLSYKLTIKTWYNYASLAVRDSLDLSVFKCDSMTKPEDVLTVYLDSIDTLSLAQGISVNWFRTEYTFSSPGCYLLCVVDPNLDDGILNIVNSVNVPMAFNSIVDVGGSLPGFLNSSPVMAAPGVVYGRPFQKFTYDPLLADVDGDSLVVRMFNVLSNCGIGAPGYSNLDDPKFTTSGYPNQLSVDSRTGVIEWNMPTIKGNTRLHCR